MGNYYTADPSGRAVYGVGLMLLACWDCGLESRHGHRCLSLVNVVWCQVEDSATVRSLIQRSPSECVCVCVYVWERERNCVWSRKTSTLRRPRPTRVVETWKEFNTIRGLGFTLILIASHRLPRAPLVTE
jgi:hypothetical protein